MRNQNGVNENALLIRRTILHDLSVLVICRTMQISSRPTEIIIYFWKQKVAICVVDKFHYSESNYIPDFWLTLGG